MPTISEIQEWACEAHAKTNHLYDGQPYKKHLTDVYLYVNKYRHLLSEEEAFLAATAAWTHDLIEDARLTYNDVAAHCGADIADITFALTNEKGKTPSERANEKYYDGIKANKVAAFVKVCDRLANVMYGRANNSIRPKYLADYNDFVRHLKTDQLAPMFQELESLIFNYVVK